MPKSTVSSKKRYKTLFHNNEIIEKIKILKDPDRDGVVTVELTFKTGYKNFEAISKFLQKLWKTNKEFNKKFLRPKKSKTQPSLKIKKEYVTEFQNEDSIQKALETWAKNNTPKIIKLPRWSLIDAINHIERDGDQIRLILKDEHKQFGKRYSRMLYSLHHRHIHNDCNCNFNKHFSFVSQWTDEPVLQVSPEFKDIYQNNEEALKFIKAILTNGHHYKSKPSDEITEITLSEEDEQPAVTNALSEAPEVTPAPQVNFPELTPAQRVDSTVQETHTLPSMEESSEMSEKSAITLINSKENNELDLNSDQEDLIEDMAVGQRGMMPMTKVYLPLRTSSARADQNPLLKSLDVKLPTNKSNISFIQVTFGKK